MNKDIYITRMNVSITVPGNIDENENI